MQMELEDWVRKDGLRAAYPDVGKMYTVPIKTVLSYCLGNICSDRDDDRHGDVLEYEGVRPLITTCQPTPSGLQNGGRTYMIPLQAAPIALRLLQSFEKAIAQLRIRYGICEQQKKVADKSNGFISVRPWL